VITPRRGTQRLSVTRWAEGALIERPDVVVVEEPLEIRVEYGEGRERKRQSVSVTMRTPGDDFELAAGFLFTEGIVRERSDIREIAYCTGDEPQEYNLLEVRLAPSARFDPALLERNFYMTSSCGVCGKASIEAVEVRGCAPVPPGTLRVDPGVVVRIPELLRSAQPLFEKTGGIHAAALFDADGALAHLMEDVGRHNAVDKLVGRQFLDGELPLHDRILAVSGRASFELVQKAVMAGIPMMVAVGAPSSLAVELARTFGLTLLGFVRETGFNVYAGGERLA
jgi:FdhD protein